MHDRGHLDTERRNHASRALDAASLEEAFDTINAEDAKIAPAVAAAKPQIIAAIGRIVAALARGGRLFYVGAGTSGRLGVLDAAECPPTFLSDPQMIQGVIAGGDEALKRSVEQAEDDPDAAAAELDRRGLSERDVVFGIATGGTTPFVSGAIRHARRRGAATIFLACVPREQAPDEADISIRVLTGPEVLTGSTRLKAGLATKMVLNTVSTLTMVQLGKVYENLMVDVNALGCAKLTDRAIRTVMTACELDRDAARRLLDSAEWHVKTAIIMHHRGLDRPAARDVLDRAGGFVRRVLADTK